MLFLSINAIDPPLWKYLTAAGFLIPSLITDIRGKKVSLIACILGTVVGTLTAAIGVEGINAALLGSVPGGILILIALLCKGAIGTGDGLVLLMIGSFLGLWKAVGILAAALAIAMVPALVLLVTKRVERKTEFPFVPFMCAGFALSMFF